MLVLALQAPPPPPVPPPPDVLTPVVVGPLGLEPWQVANLLEAVVVGGMLLIVLWPVYRLIGRWLELRAQRHQPAELDELRARVAELEAGQARVMELEERLEFAERLLAQPRDAETMRPGGGR